MIVVALTCAVSHSREGADVIGLPTLMTRAAGTPMRTASSPSVASSPLRTSRCRSLRPVGRLGSLPAVGGAPLDGRVTVPGVERVAGAMGVPVC